MKKKNLIFLISVVLIFAALIGGYLYINKDSNFYYNQAVDLYNENKFNQARAALDKSLEQNRYNRKALLLSGKVNVILKGEADYREAELLYDEAVKHARDGNYEFARIQMAKAVKLLDNISTKSLARKKADMFLVKIENNLDDILKPKPEVHLNRARKLMGAGRYEQAFEALSKLPDDNSQAARLKSEVAYTLGLQKFEAIQKRGKKVSSYEINDAIYWLGNVQAGTENSIAARELIEKLKKLNP